MSSVSNGDTKTIAMERSPLVGSTCYTSSSSIYEYREKPAKWRKIFPTSVQKPRTVMFAGILFGTFILAMIIAIIIKKASLNIPFPDVPDSPPTNSSPFTIFSQAWIHGENFLSDRKKLELKLHEKGIEPRKGSSSSIIQKYLKNRVGMEELKDCAIIVEDMKRHLGGCIDRDMLPASCKPNTPSHCNEEYPYRSYNGSCNNLQNPDWGMAMRSFKRLLRPRYADGVSAPRKSRTGGDLPSPRHLSNKLYVQRSRPQSNYTVLLPYFGLFVDHDIIKTGTTTGYGGAPISCCGEEIEDDPSLLHPECLAIKVPANDTHYGPLGVKCIDFIRSAPATGDCPGEREQMNLATSFLDGSGTYGSFENTSRDLRTFINGLLKVTWINSTAMLSLNLDGESMYCGFPKLGEKCFKAGDDRVNMQVELTALHTLWLREHNRVALRLHSLNPQWDDERLFQEARRIVIAELQHVAYNEFLPLLLGKKVMRDHKLLIDPERGYEGYNSRVDPSNFNVFGAAAFRVGHSLMQESLQLVGQGIEDKQLLLLHQTLLNPRLFLRKGLDVFLRGLIRENASSVDSYINNELRNRLFEPPHGDHGQDLSAIGIQRGRDHGIPGYVEWRRFCGLSSVRNWEDLFQFMDSVHAQRLRDAYNFVDDIDLIPGALSEHTLPGSLVGPVHACLIARQFYHIRVGDRFWFEAQGQSGSFSPGQLEEIYKSNMARILCDNADDILTIQRHPMKSVSPENPVLKCSDLPEVNLRVWAETSRDENS